MHQTVTVEDERVVLDDAFEFEIPCDGPQVWPERIPDHSVPAKWIGLKGCGHHRLLCEDCKELYLDLMADRGGVFFCHQCQTIKAETNFIGFELINKARL
jgi:hypothetical protein